MEPQTEKRIGLWIAVPVDAFLLLACCLAAVIAGAIGWAPNEFYLYSVSVLAIIELCFFALFVLIEIISAVKISDSTWHTVFLAVCLLCFHFTTVDFVEIFSGYGANVYTVAADDVNFLAFVLVQLAFVSFWDYTYSLGIPRKFSRLLAGWGLFCFAAYVPLDFFGLGVIAFFLFSFAFTATLIYVDRKAVGTGKLDATFYTTAALSSALTGSELTSTLCAAVGFPANGFPSFLALPMIVIFLSIYTAFAMRTDRAALRASEYKLQYERIKARALREQIKPHFVFNALAAIQSLYRIGLEEGDRATTLLSQHLRNNIEASDTDLIPFERELDNIQVYIDLENMRLSEKINVIFDIDCTDFEVPVLSLQPYIENAIKYSRVNEKEDGYIRISSRRDGKCVLLEVADNGVGFDPRSIPPTSCGIRNSRERFEMLMGVEPEIVSKPHEGTAVRILLPMKKQADGDDAEEDEP